MGFPCRRVQTQAGGVEIWADGNHRLDKKAINEEEAERIFMLMFVNLNASFWPVVPKGNTYPPVCGVEICKGVKSSSRVDLGVVKSEWMLKSLNSIKENVFIDWCFAQIWIVKRKTSCSRMSMIILPQFTKMTFLKKQCVLENQRNSLINLKAWICRILY